MTEEKKPKLKVVFAPGCFDDFDGTQEELDALIADIEARVADGSFMEQSVPLDDMSEEDWEQISEHLDMLEKSSGNRTLQ